jgi:hypothetical protein
MTTLSGNPNPAPWEMEGGEQKTSVMAITSLVLALICFIPGLSVLAIVMGVAALLMISKSGGKLRGGGLAVAGLLVGVLVTAVWIAALVGMRQATKFFESQFIAPVATSLKALQAGDIAGAKKILDPAVSATLTDADFQKFKDGYTPELGDFEGAPDGIMQVFEGYSALGQQMQTFQGGGGNDRLPVPAKFKNGWALVTVYIDPQGGQAGGGTMISAKNLSVTTPSGKVVMLIPESPTGVPAPVPAPGDGTDTPAPGEDAPKTDEKK